MNRLKKIIMNSLLIDTPNKSKIDIHEEENVNTGTTVVIVHPGFSNVYHYPIEVNDENWLTVNPKYYSAGTSLKLHETKEETEHSFAHSEGEKEGEEDFDLNFAPNFKSFKKRVRIKSVTKHKHKGVL